MRPEAFDDPKAEQYVTDEVTRDDGTTLTVMGYEGTGQWNDRPQRLQFRDGGRYNGAEGNPHYESLCDWLRPGEWWVRWQPAGGHQGVFGPFDSAEGAVIFAKRLVVLSR